MLEADELLNWYNWVIVFSFNFISTSYKNVFALYPQLLLLLPIYSSSHWKCDIEHVNDFYANILCLKDWMLNSQQK